jgi:uncharacterized protein
MIAVDTQLLVYALREDSEFHSAALKALTGLAESEDRWAIPWPCVHEYLAISTHPRIYNPPTPLTTAWQAMDAWRLSPGLCFLSEGSGYDLTLRDLCLRAKISGPMIHDTRIAALCLHHRVKELWSADRDFSRYPDLKIRNPLATFS